MGETGDKPVRDKKGVATMAQIEVTNKSRFDGRYWASINGCFARSGATKTEAKDNCLDAIAEQGKHNIPAYFRANDGTLFILYYADGWTYDILHVGATQASGCIMGKVSEREAKSAVLAHIAQWNESCKSA